MFKSMLLALLQPKGRMDSCLLVMGLMLAWHCNHCSGMDLLVAQDFVSQVESQPGEQKLIGFSKRGSVHHATPGRHHDAEA